MAGTTFAAIDVGSYQVEMVIYEITSKGMTQMDHVRHIIALGRDTYNEKNISFALIDELCEVLYDFTSIMKTYEVKAYRACATSAVREAGNSKRIIDRIKMRTGLDVEILSNSEQRLIIYEAVASKQEQFDMMTSQGVAMADVGAGSAQVSLFDNGTLVTTQNLHLGALRLVEVLNTASGGATNTFAMMEEYIDTEIDTLKHLFIKDRTVQTLVLVGDSLNWLISRIGENHVRSSAIYTREEFFDIFHSLSYSDGELSRRLGMSQAQTSIILPSAMIYKKILEVTNAVKLWIPCVRLCDGIASEYARREKKLYLFDHDFNLDIIAAAKNISKRYSWNKDHIKFVEKNSLAVFDLMKKYHGLGKRERLILQISCILHDCGQYISMLYPAECSYSIIMSTEIIGLSHMEREMVANIVKYTTIELDADDRISESLDEKAFLTVTKLTAIVKLCNALDRGHKQKLKNTEYRIRDRKLDIITKTFEDITLERGLLPEKAALFEEVYGLKPAIAQKKIQEV